MAEILKSYKVRLYPNPEQAINLNKTFGCVRVIWNHLVVNFNSYGTDQYIEKFSEKEIKANPDLHFLSEVSAGALACSDCGHEFPRARLSTTPPHMAGLACHTKNSRNGWKWTA